MENDVKGKNVNISVSDKNAQLLQLIKLRKGKNFKAATWVRKTLMDISGYIVGKTMLKQRITIINPKEYYTSPKYLKQIVDEAIEMLLILLGDYPYTIEKAASIVSLVLWRQREDNGGQIIDPKYDRDIYQTGEGAARQALSNFLTKK